MLLVNPPSPGFSSKCMHRLLTAVYPFFLDLSHGRLSQLVFQDRSSFGFSFQIPLSSLRSILELCAWTKVLSICNTNADSRRSHTMPSPFTDKPPSCSQTFLCPHPHLLHHLLWHLWINNFRTPLLLSMV